MEEQAKQLMSLFQSTIIFAVFNSFITFGVIETLKCATKQEKLHRFLSLGITYAIGTTMGFMLMQQIPLWQHISYGLFIGSLSVATYESAVKSLKDLIPTIVEKFKK